MPCVPQDEQFVVQYCLTASWPSLSIAEEMLSYTSNRFPCCQIQTALAKLATFASVYGPDNFEYVQQTSLSLSLSLGHTLVHLVSLHVCSNHFVSLTGA